jgi:hypothetical protein
MISIASHLSFSKCRSLLAGDLSSYTRENQSRATTIKRPLFQGKLTLTAQALY